MDRLYYVFTFKLPTRAWLRGSKKGLVHLDAEPCIRVPRCSTSRICGKFGCPLKSNTSCGKLPEEGSLVGIKFRNVTVMGMVFALFVVRPKTKITSCLTVCLRSSAGLCLVRLSGSSGLPSLFLARLCCRGSVVSHIVCCGLLLLFSGHFG
jgi:hypothetical protein